MNLADAINVLDQPALVEGVSDVLTIASIQAAPKYVAGKKLTTVPSLAGYFAVRPADALLNLAYATRATGLHTDVYGAYVEWAWLRYLGLLANYNGQLGVSAAGQRVRGNQRRVMSEELGIAFAVTVGARWMAQTFGSGTVTFIDLDVVPDGSGLSIGGGRHTVTHVTGRRPDYFMMHTDPTAKRTAVRLLECKGTLNPAHQATQLASAVAQLKGVHVNGVVPTGLAVSVATPDDGFIRFVAVDPPGDDDALDIAPEADLELDQGFDGADDQTRREPEFDRSERPAGGLLEATWAQLSDFAGNADAAIDWAPDTLRSRLFQRTPRDRVPVETDIGLCIGRRGLVAFGDRTVEAFCGVPVDLDSALTTGDPSRVLATQAVLVDQFEEYEAYRTEELEGLEGGSPRESALSVRSDGAVLQVRVFG